MPPLSLTLNPKFLGHSGLPETLAFSRWAKSAPAEWLTSEPRATGISSPFDPSCTAHSRWGERASSPFIRLASWSRELGERNHPSGSDIFKTPGHFSKAPKCQNCRRIPLPRYRQHSLGARLATFIFSPDCVSPGRCAVQAVQTLLLLVAAPRPQAPGCTDQRLSPTCGPCLVPLIRLLSWSGANGPRSGHFSFRASCWLRYPLMCEDIWGLCGGFLAALMCSPHSDAMYTVRFYVQGEPNEELSLLLLTADFCWNSLWCY